MIFETWAKAESYLDDYAKQQGFCLRKKRRIPDPHDNNITRRRTFECSHANVHESEKVVLAENRRDRDSEMIGCTWHTNLAFPKKEKGVQEMLEKIKFWTIHGKMGIPSQYNLLVASFPNKTINKKDLSNAIQKFKLQMTPSRNDACQVLNNLYLEKEKNPLWLVKPRFDTDERRLNSLFWMSPEQIRFYERYHDVVIIDSTSQTNQFDMILLLITVVDNNFRNLIVGAAIIEDEIEATFSWILQEL
ncbi:protein FAR1-RELATED SEQUENCE 5-like [Rhizophagus irregularis DAOM 181602=DAOM 197198]|nr:protein FAR1-RELATED SEQUENCE 5-like [Rhizophagus irregularis DAOM 181602=DAOM 197198]